jgi:peptide methionine sulfoxide reductase MsrA
MATTGTAVGSEGESSESETIMTVTIQVDAKLEVQSVSPDAFEISKNKHQQIFWRASDPKAQFNVEFDEGSPFQYTQFSNVEPYSGLVRREVLGDPGRYYKYTVRTGKKSIDPGGYVNP